MSHHSGPRDEELKAFRERFQNQDTTDQIRDFHSTLGPTLDFPAGTLGDDDEGGLRIGATAAEGKVVLAFGKSIDWIGFRPDQARDIAQLLLDKASECDGVQARVRRVPNE